MLYMLRGLEMGLAGLDAARTATDCGALDIIVAVKSTSEAQGRVEIAQIL